MTELQQVSAFVGFLLPLVVAIVQKSHWPRAVRTVIGVICAVVAALITAAVDNRLDFHTWATSVIYILTLAFTTYRNLWVPLGAIDWIEAVTSGKPVEDAQVARVARTGEARGPGAAGVSRVEHRGRHQ